MNTNDQWGNRNDLRCTDLMLAGSELLVIRSRRQKQDLHHSTGSISRLGPLSLSLSLNVNFYFHPPIIKTLNSLLLWTLPQSFKDFNIGTAVPKLLRFVLQHLSNILYFMSRIGYTFGALWRWDALMHTNIDLERF